MRERLAALRRLSAVYQMIEEMHLAETRGAAAAVVEAQGAIWFEEACAHKAKIGQREALFKDDRASWLLAVLHEEIATSRKRQLEPILEQRKERSEGARNRYLESKLWSEKMKSVATDVLTRASIEGGRCAQLVADDRFLAMKLWQQRQGKRLAKR